ncbi:MAG: hypothetical protein M3P32_08905, partial [Chloroflexota bacterium]|nr:hypothetical protein [Chloroflexota bacterium]
MPSLARRLAAITVLLLSVAIIAVLGLFGMGFRTGLLDTPTPGAATATPLPSASQDALTVFGQIEDQVRSLRGLP